MTTSIKSKEIAAFKHGKMDFHAGASLNPKKQIPPSFCEKLTPVQKKRIEQAWANGWLDAFVNDDWWQSLPEGFPA